MAPRHDNRQRPSVHAAPADRPSSSGGDGGSGAQTLITRRRFLYGAVGVGAVAAIGIGGVTYSSSMNEAASGISALDVPSSALATLGDFEALDGYEDSVRLVGEYDLPYGSLVWANDESIAACLLPTESGSPLAQAGLLFLGNGSYSTVLEKAVGASEGYEIYDVRANSKGMVWTEANIMQSTWRVYSAAIESDVVGSPALLEEGGDAYETPTLAVCGAHAFWQVNARASEDATELPPARLMRGPFGSEGAETVLESARGMCTPPYASDGTVTVAPRVDSPSLYYQLTNIDAETGEVRDTVTLPHSVTPVEAGYGDTGFMFSFPDIYDFEGGISNLGTYTPRRRPADGDYNGAEWFNFARTPTAAPAWCNGLLVVKSTYSVCGVDLDAGTYFVIDVDDGADTYGEYLASTGSGETFVTYTNIDHTPVGEQAIHTCRVKVWTTP